MSDALVLWIAYLFLIFCRMAALFTLSPVLGRANIPSGVKIILSAILALIIVNLRPPPGALPVSSTLGYALLLVNELLVGLAVGYITTVFFAVVFTAGQLIDMQTGFGMVQVFDVQANIQVPIFGSALNLLLLLTFILADGHVALISILFQSYEHLPVGSAILSLSVVEAVLKGFVSAFTLSINIAVPVVAAALLAEVGLGIIVRTAPQMNVFVLGIPIKVIIGFLIIYMMIPIFMSFSNVIFDEMFHVIDTALQAFAA